MAATSSSRTLPATPAVVESPTLAQHEALQRERAQADNYIRLQATKGGLIGLGIGALAFVFVGPRLFPIINRISVGPRTFLVTSCGLAGFAIESDLAVTRYARKIWLEKHAHLITEENKKEPANSEVQETWMEYIGARKWQACGIMWLVGIAGSLALSMNKPGINLAQKLIHARLYAQYITVGTVMAVFSIPSPPRKVESMDHYLAELQRSRS